MNDEEKLLLTHLRDLSERSDRAGIYTFSNFLSLPEQDLFLRNVREYGFRNYRFEGGSESAERRIVVFGSEEDFGYPPELPITALLVEPLQEKYGEELSHRDILGAMMSLQIDRSLTGDIIVCESQLIDLERGVTAQLGDKLESAAVEKPHHIGGDQSLALLLPGSG